MRQLIDVRNAADLERFLTPYTSAEEAQAFAQLMQLSGKRESLDLARRVISNEQSRVALDRLESLWNVIESLGLTNCFEIDFGDVARLDYYTGLTFKVYVTGAGSRVGSGGRYDGLTASFGKAEPAVGFVVDLDALTDVLRVRAKESPGVRNLQAQKAEIAADNLFGSSATDPSELFLRALERRARGERVSLSLAAKSTE
jgi:ATP phosphoribosyltransferase regulatory subunit